MQNVEIGVDADSISISTNHKVTGVIYISTDNFSFPESSWNDFIVTILIWWAEKFEELLTQDTKKSTFSFMDGPFYFEIERLTGDIVSIAFIEELDRKITHKFIYANKNEIMKSLLQTINLVIRTCKTLGYELGDVATLESRYNNLQQQKNIGTH